MGFIHCLIYFAILGVLSFVIGRLLPKGWFKPDHFPFRSFAWEKNGSIYHKLHIKKWQNKVPDMSKIFPKLMQPKKLQTGYENDLPLMIRETCIAEAVHTVLCVAGLYCLRLWAGLGGILMTALYILLGNVPFILIQRYNRPRLCRLQAKIAKNNPEKEMHTSYANSDLKLQYRTGA